MSKAKFKPATVRGALALIEDHGGARAFGLSDRLAEAHGASFTRMFGQHRVRIGGVYAASRISLVAALEVWCRAARRRLLKEPAP